MIVSDGKAMQAALDRWHKPFDEQLRLMREEHASCDKFADPARQIPIDTRRVAINIEYTKATYAADHSIDCDCILCVDGDE